MIRKILQSKSMSEKPTTAKDWRTVMRESRQRIYALGKGEERPMVQYVSEEDGLHFSIRYTSSEQKKR